MAAGDAFRGRGSPVGEGRRNRFAAAGAVLGILVAGASIAGGGGRFQAAGVGLFVLGVALWLGAMKPNPATGPIDAEAVRQRYRSRAIAIGLGALVVIFYAATIIRLGPNALRKESYPGAGATKNVIIEDKGLVVAPCKQAGTC